MFKRIFKFLSLVISWLDVFFDSSKKLYPGRMAYKHELRTLAITQFDGNHLLIGEGDYDQVYAIKPTTKRRELGNMIKLGTTRCGKSSAELCQLVDWDGSAIIFDIKREIYPKVAGYLATRGRLINIDLSRGIGNQYDPLQGHTSERELHKLAKHLIFDPHDKDTIFSERAAKMLTQLLLAARELGSDPCRMWQASSISASMRLPADSMKSHQSFLKSSSIPPTCRAKIMKKVSFAPMPGGPYQPDSTPF